jgi:hypothetical protein
VYKLHQQNFLLPAQFDRKQPYQFCTAVVNHWMSVLYFSGPAADGGGGGAVSL